MGLKLGLWRDLMRLAAVGGGVVFASGLPGCAVMRQGAAGAADFNFVRLSDIHWGYNNASVNPDFKGTMRKAIAAVNGLRDLAHTTDDPKVRRTRLREFREMVSAINVPVRYMSGEHDAALDRGEAYQEVFGSAMHYAFDRKGI